MGVMKVPCSRPSDFYAEMLRPDATMYKVRKWASEEQRRIRIVEDRKKAKSAKKFQKKAKAHKMQARAHEKQQTLDDIAAYKRQSKGDKKNANEDDLENILSRAGKEEKREGKWWQKENEKSRKRQAINERFGYGGK